jgi:hypothetical protein
MAIQRPVFSITKVKTVVGVDGCAGGWVTRETAPDILLKIVERINEKGVLTRQELRDIVKSQQVDSKQSLP